MQTMKRRMKDSYKVLVAVVLSVATVFGVQYGVLDYFENPDKASAQVAGVRVQPGDNFTTYYDLGLTPSQTRNDDVPYAMPWEAAYAYVQGQKVPTLIDMNGDGLTDMVFSDGAVSVMGGAGVVNFKSGQQWVALNVGDGYELVYYCKITTDYNGGQYGVYNYYGDCAA